MTESKIAAEFDVYREALGGCARRPVRKRVPRPYIILSPLAAAVAVVLVATVLPAVSRAAALNRLDDAITNVKSMICRQYIRDPEGKWKLWEIETYSNGKYRTDLPVNDLNMPVTFIYKDKLCYEVLGNLDHATVRPESANPFAPKLGGEALDVIERELHDRAKGSQIQVKDGRTVDGKDTYEVHFDRPVTAGFARHIVLVVDRDTNLPMYADYDQASTWGGSAHWDFQFNIPVSQARFDPPAHRPLFDLRKTIPAFVRSHHLANVDGLDVLDACVTDDGTVWVATGLQPKAHDVTPNVFEADNRLAYSSPQFGFDSTLSDKEGVTIWGFVTAGSMGSMPKRGTLTFKKFTKSMPIPDSDATTAMEDLGPGGRATFALRQEKGDYPSYFVNLGFETWRPNVMFDIRRGQIAVLTKQGKFGKAAVMLEAIGDQCKPENRVAYLDWMSQALSDFRRAGMTPDEARVERKMSAARGTSGQPPQSLAAPARSGGAFR